MSHSSLIGKKAPSFTLPNHDGQSFTFSPGEKGIPAVVFFYPEAGSYGCTREACQFRDAVAEKPSFKTDKVEIIGISTDPIEKQKKFVEKEKLNYPVLSDTSKEAVTAYKVGKGILGLVSTARVTFIIDRNGIVRDSLDATMNYGAHSKFAVDWLQKLEAEEVAPTATSTASNPQPS